VAQAIKVLARPHWTPQAAKTLMMAELSGIADRISSAATAAEAARKRLRAVADAAQQAAAVGAARLRRLAAAQKLQVALEQQAAERGAAAAVAAARPRALSVSAAAPVVAPVVPAIAPVAVPVAPAIAAPQAAAWPWEAEQATLKAGLPPSCDWDTLVTRTLTGIRRASSAAVPTFGQSGAMALHLVTAYVCSLPYAWNSGTGVVASLTDLAAAEGLVSTQGGADGAWHVYEPYCVLRWLPLGGGGGFAPQAYAETIVTLSQLQNMGAGGQGMGTLRTASVALAAQGPPDWPAEWVGQDVASFAAEVVRVYSQRYGNFRDSWAAWWAVATRPMPPPSPPFTAFTATAAMEEEEALVPDTWQIQTVGSKTPARGSRKRPREGAPTPSAPIAHPFLPGAADSPVHMRSPDLVSPGELRARAAAARSARGDQRPRGGGAHELGGGLALSPEESLPEERRLSTREEARTKGALLPPGPPTGGRPVRTGGLVGALMRLVRAASAWLGWRGPATPESLPLAARENGLVWAPKQKRLRKRSAGK